MRVPRAGGPRRRAVRALPALLVVVGACGGGEPALRPTATPGSPVERAEPTAEEQIAAVLDARAAALEAGRPQAYAATAAGALRRSDRVHARRARRLRLRDVFLTARDIEVRGRRATARVTTLYSLAGVRGEFRVKPTDHAPPPWRLAGHPGAGPAWRAALGGRRIRRAPHAPLRRARARRASTSATCRPRSRTATPRCATCSSAAGSSAATSCSSRPTPPRRARSRPRSRGSRRSPPSPTRRSS